MRIIITKELSKKIRGLITSLSYIRNISQKNIDENKFNDIVNELKNLCKTRFNTPDSLISSKIVSRYHSFFRDILKLNLAETKPKNEVFGTLMLSSDNIKYSNYVDGLIYYLSGATGYPIFGFDADSIRGDLLIRYSTGNEKFIREDNGDIELLDEDQIIISDSEKVIMKYPYIQSKDVKITEKTKNILLMVCGVPGIVGLNLLWALKLSTKLINELFSGKPSLILQEIMKDEVADR
ncbi:MAG: B3/B4 domain-containing protein [Candidatus Odinarchaeia archaeon]